MDVFISWSGERSRAAAEALRNWLPKIINAIKPWLSVADIEKGARWGTDLATRLKDAKAGIICLTPGNLHSDWILFETGALSKTLENTYVCPLLIGLEPSDLKGPLAQFQATKATKNDVVKLLKTLNVALAENRLQDSHIEEAFEVWWPKLEQQLTGLPSEKTNAQTHRPDRELLEEILVLVRNQGRLSPPEQVFLERELQPISIADAEVIIRNEAIQIGDPVSAMSTSVGGSKALKTEYYTFHIRTEKGNAFPLHLPTQVPRSELGPFVRHQLNSYLSA